MGRRGKKNSYRCRRVCAHHLHLIAAAAGLVVLVDVDHLECGAEELTHLHELEGAFRDVVFCVINILFCHICPLRVPMFLYPSHYIPWYRGSSRERSEPGVEQSESFFGM